MITEADLHAVIATLNRAPNPVPAEAAGPFLRAAIDEEQRAITIANGASLPGPGARARTLAMLHDALDARTGIPRDRLQQLTSRAISDLIAVQDAADAKDAFAAQVWNDLADGTVNLATNPLDQVKQAIDGAPEVGGFVADKAGEKIGALWSAAPAWVKYGAGAIGVLAILLIAAEIRRAL